MKMVIRGTEKVEKTQGIMDTGVVGLEWEVKAKMVPQSGQKLYVSCCHLRQYFAVDICFS